MTNKEKEYLNYTECERCWSHEQIEDTLIFQTIDGKWYLRSEYDIDEEETTLHEIIDHPGCFAPHSYTLNDYWDKSKE